MLRKLNKLTRSLALTLVLVGAPSGAVLADQARDQLIKNARYWQERGRTDKAVDAWRRVLVSDPRNVEALVQVGTFHSRRGRVDKAREYLLRLREVSPDHPGVATLERALATGVGYDDLLGQARAAVREGKAELAVGLYRQAFGAGAPPEDLALEYYQTVGGTQSGWEEAQRGLEKLAASAGTPAVKLALAKHLTYREKTRRQGIAQLRELAAEPRLGGEASKAWRQALLWLQPASGDGALYVEYLTGRTDAEVARKAEEHKKVASRGGASAGPSAVQAGYEALSRADVESASRLFDRAARGQGGQGGKDPQVLVGMGVVALQQQDFARAREIFAKVKQLAPGRPELWERSLRSASFWSLVREAEALRQARRLDDAARKLEEAIRVSPEERSHATVAMAEVARDRGAVVDAELALRQVLETEPTHAGALAALLRLYVEAQRVPEAEEMNARLAQVDASKALPAERLRAELLRGRAASLIKSGQLEKARLDLQEARSASPDSPEVLVDLAYLQLSLDDGEGAEQSLAALAKLAPRHVEILRLRVRLLELGKRYAEALKLLATVPGRDLDESWRATRDRLEVRAEAAHLVARAHRGALAGSRLRLIELERRANGRPELLLIVAEAWADAGDVTRAAALAHQVSARSTELGAGARLHLAAVYLRARRESELEELLRELTAEPTLTARERADLEKLRVAHAVRRADRLRDGGELELALNEVAPLLREAPENPRLLCALGRLFRAGNENREAHGVFMRVLRANPEDFEARQGAVESALWMHDRESARRLSEEAQKKYPRDARVHLLAGRFALMTGEDAAAAEAFRTAQEILNANAPAAPGLNAALAMERSTSDVLQVAALKLNARSDSAEAQESDLPLQVQAELDKLNAKKSVEVRADFEARTREGYGGLAGITELRVPVTASVPLGFRGRLAFTATPLVLDTGAIVSTPEMVQAFGSFGVDPSLVPTGSLERSVSAATLALSYSHRWLSLDVGSTPLGLPLQAVVGGAALRGQVGRLGLAASASRRAVNDSMLSYVGMKDPILGVSWGRVLSDSGRLDLSIDTEPALLYLFGSYARLDGKHVADNQMVMGGTGVEWELYELDETKVVSGLGVTYLAYDKNLRYFTIGHGGYFSPQRFIHAGVPLKGRGRSGNFAWELNGDLGLNWFREKAAPYYPTVPQFQTARAGQVDAMAKPLDSVFPGRNSLSLAADLAGRASYQLTPNIRAGLHATYRHADYFRELLGGLWLELALRKQTMKRPVGL